MTTPIVLLAIEPDDFRADQMQAIENAAKEGGQHIVMTTSRAEMEEHLDDIEIAFHQFPKELMAQAPNLRWYQQWGAGADWLLKYPELAELNLTVTNASGVHSIPISEHIFAFLLSFARGFPNQMRGQMQSEWRRPSHHGSFELAGKRMLLVGVGAIGARTAEIANALGMNIVGVRRNPQKAEAGIARMVGADALHEELPDADFVVITTPLTDETHHMFGASEFTHMKRSAYIINIGRGPIIDQDALIAALQNGEIAGAGLDVTTPEPLPADSPLWAMENVIITAHYSGMTPHYHDRIFDIFMENWRRYRAGKALMNVVDKRIGY